MPSRRRNTLIRALGLCLLVPLAACGTSPAAPTPGPRGIVFPVTFAFSGAVSASGGFTDATSANTSTSCSEFGRNGIVGTYFIPSPPPGQKLRGQTLAYASLVAAYHGPAEYTDVHSLVTVTVGDGVFQAGERSTLKLLSRPDGSGTVEFSTFHDVSDPSSMLSGRIDWTCSRAS